MLTRETSRRDSGRQHQQIRKEEKWRSGREEDRRTGGRGGGGLEHWTGGARGQEAEDLVGREQKGRRRRGEMCVMAIAIACSAAFPVPPLEPLVLSGLCPQLVMQRIGS